MKTLFFILLLIFNIKVFPQSLIYPNLPSDNINDLVFLNENEIIFANDGGSIFKSYDGGKSWERKFHLQGIPLEEISFIDDKIGFIKPDRVQELQNEGLVITLDGGETWKTHLISIYDAVTILPLTETTIIKSTFGGTIEKLDNFFNSWDTLYQIPAFTDSSTEFGPIEIPYGIISHLDQLPSGRIIGLGINNNAKFLEDSLSFIIKSDDLGLSWDTLWVGLPDFAADLQFLDDQNGWMIVGKSILKTDDDGYSWGEKYFLENGTEFTDFFAVDSNNLFAVTYRYWGQELYKSSDVGNIWTSIPLLEKAGEFKINFSDPLTGFLFGSEFLFTNNGGEELKQVDSSYSDNIYFADFIDANSGFAVGESGIYKTENGGKSWQIKLTFEGSKPLSFKMINNDYGWMTNLDDFIYIKEGGENLEKIVLSEDIIQYGKVIFYDDYFGVLYGNLEKDGSGDEINSDYITVDKGLTWEKVVEETNSKVRNFDKLQILSPERIYGLNMDGLWLSEDSLKSWESIYNAQNSFVGKQAFYFYDAKFGMLTTSYFDAYFTADSGRTWTMYDKPVGNHPSDCVILGNDIFGRKRALEVGEDGKILFYYIDKFGNIEGSRSLTTFTKKTFNDIAVYVNDSMPHFWAVGDGFSVFYREYEKIFTDVNENNKTILSYELEQNYPNPFNPETTIKYSIPSSNKNVFVSLRIYDILGKEIKTLVNKEQSAGVYEVKFNGAGLASGVYLYKLEAGDFSDSKKFVLMK